MAPEVFQGNPTPLRSDIYSLGNSLYFMMNGKLPDLFHEVAMGKFKISEKMYTKDLHHLVSAMLKPDPQERPIID